MTFMLCFIRSRICLRIFKRRIVIIGSSSYGLSIDEVHCFVDNKLNNDFAILHNLLLKSVGAFVLRIFTYVK